MQTFEERRGISLEWAQQVYYHHKAYFDTLVEADTRPTYYEAVKFNVEGSLDYLNTLRSHSTMCMRERTTYILLVCNGVGRSTGYPARGNRYYWNKKGQPKLRKLRDWLEMYDITKWERDYLFPMAYKKE